MLLLNDSCFFALCSVSPSRTIHNTSFRLRGGCQAARNGITIEPDTIPDGFYLVGDSENPQDDFQAAVIAAVKEV